MPKRLKIAEHLSLKEIGKRFRASRDVTERTHWQVIQLLMQGHYSEQVAALTGYTMPWVRQIAARYNQRGPQALVDARHRNPGPKPLLTQAQREQLRVLLEQPVPAEMGGGLWNGPKVALWMASVLGTKVHPQRGHEMLRALGYSSQVPRPCHAQADPQAQEAFKKHWHKS